MLCKKCFKEIPNCHIRNTIYMTIKSNNEYEEVLFFPYDMVKSLQEDNDALSKSIGTLRTLMKQDNDDANLVISNLSSQLKSVYQRSFWQKLKDLF